MILMLLQLWWWIWLYNCWCPFTEHYLFATLFVWFHTYYPVVKNASVCLWIIITILFSVVTSAKRVSARQQTRGSVGTSASAGPDTREGSAKTKVSLIFRFQCCQCGRESTWVSEQSECSPNFLMFAGTAVAALKWCFLPSLARPRCCYMIRPLCKQVWRMTAYLDLSSTARAAFIELLRSFLSTFLQYLQPASKSYLTPDNVQILSFLIIISYDHVES